uniref:Uncharacterized protein n=1 Tax=Manihot esculenta TaxID=3983 RepID=A0A2C9W2Y0_MANES
MPTYFALDCYFKSKIPLNCYSQSTLNAINLARIFSSSLK